MPGETTYYRRLQVLLELSAARKPRIAADLINGIARKSPPSFVYHRWDPEKNEITARCSESAIEKTFKLAGELGLIEPRTGILTNVGKAAADPASFDRILRQQLISHFKGIGCSASELEETSRSLLRSKKVKLPTAEELYSDICLPRHLDLPFSRFRILLKLFASCGGMTTSRRQIFLPSDGK